MRELTDTDTRVVAARWIERHAPRGARVAVDPGIPRQGGSAVVPLSSPGTADGFDPRRDVAALVAVGVRFVVVNGDVAAAVRTARGRYAREASFYDALDVQARRVYAVRPGGGLRGPRVAVYRLPLRGEQEA